MGYRRKTLRGMSPVSRKLARLSGELDSVSRRLKHIIENVESLELDSRALKNAREKGDGINENSEIF